MSGRKKGTKRSAEWGGERPAKRKKTFDNNSGFGSGSDSDTPTASLAGFVARGEKPPSYTPISMKVPPMQTPESSVTPGEPAALTPIVTAEPLTNSPEFLRMVASQHIASANQIAGLAQDLSEMAQSVANIYQMLASVGNSVALLEHNQKQLNTRLTRLEACVLNSLQHPHNGMQFGRH